MQSFDIAIIGAGIAGASIAAQLSAHQTVVLLDMEDRTGYHTTGRSAASYEPNYGPPPMLAFTRASAEFFKNPPRGFSEAPLLAARPSLFLEAEGQQSDTEKLLALATDLQEISMTETHALFPVLRQDYASRSFLDRQTADMDVDLIHRGFLKIFKQQGGTLLVSAGVSGLERSAGTWQIITACGPLSASIIVNAAGAWGDGVAAMAGAKPCGLTPKRRSIAVIPYARATAWNHWPMVTDVGETWYCKPQSGKLIVSSADATPVEPHDAYADDMAIALGVERLMTATTIAVERLEHTWGGLRTFAPDGHPVIGFDPSADGFFWLVGQGGYGIQSAPALSETAAAMLLGKPVPAHVQDFSLDLQHITPERFS